MKRTFQLIVLTFLCAAIILINDTGARARESNKLFQQPVGFARPLTIARTAAVGTLLPLTETSAMPLPSATSAYTLYLALVVRPVTAGAPVISSFTASPSVIAPGQSSTLSWSVSGATSLSISPGVGPVTGTSVSVSPTTTTEYVLTASNAAGSTTARTTVTVTSGVASVGLFLNQTNQTNSAQIAVDASGGIHIAYAAYGPDDNGNQPAYYAYCAAQCAARANWRIASISDRVNEVVLALDAAGRPRLLIYGEDENAVNRYQYAACDANCTTGANWQIANLVTVNYINISVWDYSQHYFALDPQGRPRFVYYDNDGSIHNGTFYAFCDTNCTNAANWFEIKLHDGLFSDPALAFTSAGQPRIASVIYTNSGMTPAALAYVACDTDCTNPANWDGSFLEAPRGSGHASYVLRLDASDRPRIAFYPGSLDSGQGQRLYYLWCNTDCIQAGNWDGASVGLAAPDGMDPDLAFDSQNRPRIAYWRSSPDGLGYATCDSNCESASATWQHRVLEPSATLDAEWPIPPPTGCTDAFWYGGYRSSLALDAAGVPHIAYDAEHLYGGGSCTGVTVDFRTIRIVILDRPLHAVDT
jgi:hypothetical protein